MVITGTELLELFSKFVLLGQIVKVHSCSKYKHYKKTEGKANHGYKIYRSYN